jgi:hypothetical protein
MPVAVFSAYFDASGTKSESAVLTVAGFVARIPKWDRFNQEWKAILAEHNVTQMHMTDFAASRQEFVSWKGQTERRREFVSRLARCIKRNTNKGFASSVILSEYRGVDARFALRERVGKPYTLCTRACLGALKAWAKKKNVKPNHILVFVEQGDEDQGELIRWAAKEDGFTVVPLLKGKAQAFQAGDLVGWKTRIALQNVPRMKSEEDRDNILRSLDPIKPIVQRNAGFDEEALLKICTKSGIPPR